MTMTDDEEVWEQLHTAKPGKDFEIVLVDKYLKPVSEEVAKRYWAKKYGLEVSNDRLG